MFLTDRKLERRIAELKEHRYRDIINLNEFTVQEDTQGVGSLYRMGYIACRGYMERT